MNEQKIYITDFDLKRLKKLLGVPRPAGTRKNPYLEELKKEVEKAVVVLSKDIPKDVITMNSTIRLVDLDSKDEYEYTLVFPEAADSATGKISILAPVGTAMLGFRVRNVIEWPVPAERRRRGTITCRKASQRHHDRVSVNLFDGDRQSVNRFDDLGRNLRPSRRRIDFPVSHEKHLVGETKG